MPAHILIVDDEPDIRELVSEILADEGYRVEVAADATQAKKAVGDAVPDLVLLDIWMPDIDGITLLRDWRQQGELAYPVIMMSGHGNIETAVEATKLGAWDFIEKPIALAKLLLSVERALEAGALRRENAGLRRQLPTAQEPVGVSSAIKDLRSQLQKLSRVDTWVLLRGESGVGKAQAARYLHTISNRQSGPMVELAVGSIAPENTLQELFGSEVEGQIHRGCLDLANGGSLLIEEVAEMDKETQRRLNSALEAGSFMRLGGRESIDLNVRVITTSSADLEAAVQAGDFREDLYYRLNVVPVTIPPLRDRAEDVPELLRLYAERLPQSEQLAYRHFNVAAQNRLRNYSWPGNARELENLVQRLLILGSGDVEISEIEAALSDAREAVGDNLIDYTLPLRAAREQFERAYLIHQLKLTNGSVGELAKLAGMERTHLYRKLRALEIDPKQFAGSRT